MASKLFKGFNFLIIFSIVILIITVNTFRFYKLEESPPGFHVDELATAVTIQCFATEGKDSLGRPLSLFNDLCLTFSLPASDS